MGSILKNFINVDKIFGLKTMQVENMNHSQTDKMEMDWTGERLVTQINNHIGTIEHLHRYALALEYSKGKIVLDIASGEGYGSNLLSNIAEKVIGVDISEEAVDFASRKYSKHNLEFFVGKADQIPVADNSVDVVVSFETLEHHDKHHEMMEEVKRVLNSDGILIISTPDKSIYQRRDPDNIYHIKEITTNEFQVLIKKYFSHCIFLEQRVIFGSLISQKMDKEIAPLSISNGDFSEIKSGLNESRYFINQPFFNICIASNVNIFGNQSYFFDGASVYEATEDTYKKQIEYLENSLHEPLKFKLLKRIFKMYNNLLKKSP